MIVKFWTDRMGNLHGDPVSDRKRRWVISQIDRVPHGKDALIFFQEADDYTVFEVVGPQWKDALEGYNVNARIPDEWAVRWASG